MKWENHFTSSLIVLIITHSVQQDTILPAAVTLFVKQFFRARCYAGLPCCILHYKFSLINLKTQMSDLSEFGSLGFVTKLDFKTSEKEACYLNHTHRSRKYTFNPTSGYQSIKLVVIFP